MTTPCLADEMELVHQVARIAAQLDEPLARQVIDLAQTCFDAGFASCLVRKFTPSDQARANLAAALECLPKPLERP